MPYMCACMCAHMYMYSVCMHVYITSKYMAKITNIICVHNLIAIRHVVMLTFPTESSKHRSSSLSVPILRPSGSGSPSTSPPSPHSHSPHQLNGSNGLSSSLQRRILRSRSTSLENGSELYRRVLKPLDQVGTLYIPYA